MTNRVGRAIRSVRGTALVVANRVGRAIRSGTGTALVVAAGAAVALVVAVRARPDVLFDDAAITFRYAERLADGLGFTFNDGDRTNGASAPLYTLVLASFARLGIAPEASATVLGVAGFATTTALVGVLADRVAGRWAAVVSMALLVTSTAFQNQALSGMESGVAAVLGMATLVALAERRTTLAGVLVGLAVVNRLDALALALSVVVLVWSMFGVVPRRMIAAAVVVATPWFVFATLYFGSPIPFSATQKVAGRAGASAFDPTWFLRSITGREGVVVLLLALCVPVLVLARRLRAELRSFPLPSTDSAAGTPSANQRWAVVAMLSGLMWAVLHGVAYSVVDLGAPYPWYTAVVYPVLASGAGVVVAVLVRHARGSSPVRIAAASVVLVLLLVSRAPAISFTVTTVVEGYQPRFSRELDGTRRDAGRFLAASAGPDDVIRTCFGWVAYEASRNPVDEVCPLSTRLEVGPPTWIVESPGPGEPEPVLDDAELVARFSASEVDGRRAVTSVYRSSASR